MIFKMLLFYCSAALCGIGEKDKTRQLEQNHDRSCNNKLNRSVDPLQFDIEIIKRQALYLIRAIMSQDLRDMCGSHYYRSIKFFGNDDSDVCKANTHVLL